MKPVARINASFLHDDGLRLVLAALSAAGGAALVAGGAVRNALLDLPVDDIDIATTLEPDQVMAAAAAAGLAAHPTGIDHGTVTVVAGDRDGSPARGYEVTSLRRDVATDGRRAVVAFTDDWAEDARRRDFTMNALYCSGTGEVFDPVGGLADLRARHVRFVGDPALRICEDYLRILRFFRFFARYHAGPPDAAGLAACRTLREGLHKLSRERVRHEVLRIVIAPRAVDALEAMNEAGIARVLFGREFDARAARAMAVQDGLASLAPDALLRLDAATGLGLEELRTSLKLSNSETARLRAVRGLMPPDPALRAGERRVVCYQAGAQVWRDAVRLAWARAGQGSDADWLELLRLPDTWSLPVFPVGGADLIAAGHAPGPALGRTLARLEDWWVAGDFSADRDEILARAGKPDGDAGK